MLKRNVGLGLVFAFAMLMPAAQAKAHCGHCHKEKVVSTCDPCATRTVTYKPSCCERLCCRAPKPRCGCGSTYTYRNGYYNDYSTTSYDSYSVRTYPSSYSTNGSSSGRYLTFEPETGRYIPYPTFESSTTYRTVDYRD